MTVIVTDTGFGPDYCLGEAVSPNALSQKEKKLTAVSFGPEDDVAALADRLDRIDLIRIVFPVFADGRGFTLARTLRRMGFRGRLRATGNLIADQYAMARRSGFDEVEISDDLARRQPEDQWLARADWRAHDYQARLRA